MAQGLKVEGYIDQGLCHSQLQRSNFERDTALCLLYNYTDQYDVFAAAFKSLSSPHKCKQQHFKYQSSYFGVRQVSSERRKMVRFPSLDE
jgi:hypothetical protein